MVGQWLSALLLRVVVLRSTVGHQASSAHAALLVRKSWSVRRKVAFLKHPKAQYKKVQYLS